jgi:hypothetical protein
MHRLYGFDFPFKAKDSSKEELFIPSGFDSLNLIQVGLKDNEKDLRYEDYIKINT